MCEGKFPSAIQVLAVYFTRNSKWRTLRNKLSIRPMLIAAFASLNIVRPISPVVCKGMPSGSKCIPWIMVCNNILSETISLAVSTMAMISASAEDRAGINASFSFQQLQHSKHLVVLAKFEQCLRSCLDGFRPVMRSKGSSSCMQRNNSCSDITST